MEEKKMSITIPDGCFMGNCCFCKYADWEDTNEKGYPYCRGLFGGYNEPINRYYCIGYIKK
ncbi:MAG: hypothetical protein IKE58_06305 [Blautia sp.]|nr:hypothetical protein [Blautia sp.]